jgi:hypothetical protein
MPALPGRRVRHRLTPTKRGLRPPAALECPPGDARHTLVGARRCLARRAVGAAIPQHERAHRDGNGTSSIGDGTMTGPAGPAGQAPPDPYTRRLHRPTVVGRGSTADPPPTPCRGEALPRPPRRMARQTPMACLDHVQDPTGTGTIALRRCSGPAGPAGQAPPDPYKLGTAPHRRTRMRDRGCGTPPSVGARRCLARRARGAAHAGRRPACGDHRERPPTGFRGDMPALPGRRVRHRLTPTRRARSLPDTPARHRGARYAQPTPHRCRRHGRGVGFPHAPADRHDCWSPVQVHCPVETSQAVLSFSLPSGAPQSALSARASGTTNSQTVCFSYCGGCPFTGLTGRSL